MLVARDEQLEILKNIFGLKRGLHFMSYASPTSKQSKSTIRKDVSKQAIQKRIINDDFIFNKAKNYSEGDLEIEFTFGLSKRRYGKGKNDIDNLVKHALDCLKGILFKDDSQIKELHAKKFFVNSGVKQCTGIRIHKLSPNEVNK